MNGIEKTLRDTLAKLENPDAQTRQKLYETTEQILRRSLEPFMQSRPEMAAERLQDLHDVVATIEQGYNSDSPVVNAPQQTSHSIPNVAPPVTPVEAPHVEAIKVEEPVQPIIPSVTPQVQLDPVMPEPQVHWPEANLSSSVPEQLVPDSPIQTEPMAAPVPNVSSQATTPDVLNDISDELKIQPIIASNPILDKEPVVDKKTERARRKKERRDKRRRRGSLLELIAGSIVTVIFLIFLGGGFWLFSNSEYYQLFLDWRNGGKPINAQEQVTDKNFVPRPLTSEGEQSGTWVEVFGYKDVGNVRGRGEVLVETIDDGGDGGVRITSVNSSEFGEAQVPLDATKIQSLASHKFVMAFSMFVDHPTQIYIKCLLKNGTETDRRRFELTGGFNNVMVKMDMTGVSSFDTAPYIAINSDITGKGRSVELFDVRYQITE